MGKVHHSRDPPTGNSVDLAALISGRRLPPSGGGVRIRPLSSGHSKARTFLRSAGKMARTGADVLVEGLISRGVDHIFGMPGSHSTAIYDAVGRLGRIATVLARNEQAGAFMADGYARVTARPGVICTTAGPGATNALTGVAEAWADSVPVLLIAGQVNADDLDRECGNYHEIDLEAIFRPVTKWCGTVRRAEQIPALIAQAFQAMTGGRPRPAAIFLPQDLMRQPCTVASEVQGSAPPAAPDVPRSAVFEAAEVLRAAQRPIILAGEAPSGPGPAKRFDSSRASSVARSSPPSMPRAFSMSAIPGHSATPAPCAPGRPCPMPTPCSRLAAGSPKC